MVFLGIGLGAVLSIVVGTFWYSPALFGKICMKLDPAPGHGDGCAKCGGMGKVFFSAYLNSVVMIAALYYLVRLTQAHTWEKAYPLGFLLWLGFVATVLFSGVLWEKKPLALFWVHSLYYFVTFGLALTLFLLLKIA